MDTLLSTAPLQYLAREAAAHRNLTRDPSRQCSQDERSARVRTPVLCVLCLRKRAAVAQGRGWACGLDLGVRGGQLGES